MPSPDHTAAYKLIHDGTTVEFEIVETKITPSSDEGNSIVRIELQLGSANEDEGDGESQAEWGGIGFIFILATLSFADSRPRAYQGRDFVEKDEFTVADFLECLRFQRGELHFEADYIRDRCVKTDITVRRDGHVTLATTNRGEAATRWVARLKGKKILAEVK